MAVLTKQKVTLGGTTPTYAAAAGGGDEFVNNQASGSRTFLHVKNTSGGIITVTIDDPNSREPEGSTEFNPDLAVEIPATTGDKMIGPIGPRFIDADGNTNISYSGVTNLTVAVLYF